MNHKLEGHLDWFANLSLASLADISQVYHEQAIFRDPFHQLQGTPAIQAIYGRMFKRLTHPKFVIVDVLAAEQRAFVRWDFHYEWRGKARCLHGGSLLTLGLDGRIVEHLDYWDAASGVYEHLPVLGSVLRYLRRSMGA